MCIRDSLEAVNARLTDADLSLPHSLMPVLQAGTVDNEGEDTDEYLSLIHI